MLNSNSLNLTRVTSSILTPQFRPQTSGQIQQCRPIKVVYRCCICPALLLSDKVQLPTLTPLLNNSSSLALLARLLSHPSSHRVMHRPTTFLGRPLRRRISRYHSWCYELLVFVVTEKLTRIPLCRAPLFPALSGDRAKCPQCTAYVRCEQWSSTLSAAVSSGAS